VPMLFKAEGPPNTSCGTSEIEQGTHAKGITNVMNPLLFVFQNISLTTLCQGPFIHARRLFVGHICPPTYPKSTEYSPPPRARLSFGGPASLG
jgi:hypothetical protein